MHSKQYHNDPDSLTSLILATNLLALAFLEELFLSSSNLGIYRGNKGPFRRGGSLRLTFPPKLEAPKLEAP
jgi:hypothetical protein